MMTLFSAPTGLQSHRTRIVAAEKGIEIDVINVVPGRYPQDLLEVNPYFQDIIRGGIILTAVGIDAMSRRST